MAGPDDNDETQGRAKQKRLMMAGVVLLLLLAGGSMLLIAILRGNDEETGTGHGLPESARTDHYAATGHA